jgi:hypothetical protein
MDRPAPVPAPRPRAASASAPAPAPAPAPARTLDEEMILEDLVATLHLDDCRDDSRAIVCIVSCNTSCSEDVDNYETVVKSFMQSKCPAFDVFVVRSTPSKWLKGNTSALYKLVREFAGRTDPIHYIIGAHGLRTDEYSHVSVSSDIVQKTAYTSAVISLHELCTEYLPRLLDKTPGRVASVFLDVCYSGMQQAIGPTVYPVPGAPDVWWWSGPNGVLIAGHADAPLARQSACMRWFNWVQHTRALGLPQTIP